MAYSCFVISPLGTTNADYVLSEIIKRACEPDYKVTGADEETMIRGGEAFKIGDSGRENNQNKISDRILNNLKNADIVIAYLGSPEKGKGNGKDKKWLWNGNVMFEAGYRMGLRKPIVFIRSGRENESEPLLPFDILDYKVVELHNKKDIGDADVLNEKRQKIKEYCDQLIPLFPGGGGDDIESPWPAITVWLENGTGKVVGASKAAKELFKINPLTGTNINDLIQKIKSMMPSKQAEKFGKEQDEMLGKLVTGQKPKAKVCMVFTEQALSRESEIPNAWLPVIASFDMNITPWALTVVYYDVKDNAKICDDTVVRL